MIDDAVKRYKELDKRTKNLGVVSEDKKIKIAMLPVKKLANLGKKELGVAADKTPNVGSFKRYYNARYSDTKTDGKTYHAHVDFANRYLGGALAHS